MKKIHGYIWRPKKILKDPLNNIEISQIISSTFKNLKSKEELNSIKDLSQTTMKQVFKLSKVNFMFFSAYWFFLLAGFIIIIPIGVLVDKYAFIALIVLAIWPIGFLHNRDRGLLSGKLSDTTKNKNFPTYTYEQFKTFLLDIQSNFTNNSENFPLMIQQLYFKNEEIMKNLHGIQRWRIVPQDPSSPIYLKSVANFKRPFIEFPNFIIKYVDYCSTRNN